MTNPFRENAAPEVDKTAVAVERERQVGETKRKLIEEREETKRERISKAGEMPYWIRLVTVAILGLVGTVYICATHDCGPNGPNSPAQRCRDEMYPIENPHTCSFHDAVGRIQHTDHGDVFVCVCPQPPPVSSEDRR